ncbi:phage baseplate assembly protein V [Gynuella sunshinyii]|uniref:Gp5/Type VI secretion system Vgr protein OB-fold domain-containing protein n=1 Tax=Gynuella sunshinyii YC6258 TaxID=1445510 RepID=A0A0C5VJ05_9GAMM|nr:phage baseplate assembly protein V [Gynuella sunshinyii]AJQ94236.1 hypothetical protein YC6258_02198 [Gynuella sunshinyii YC6258]
MIHYNYFINGRQISGLIVSVNWQYAVNRIAGFNIRLANIDAEADTEEAGSFNLTAAGIPQAGEEITFSARAFDGSDMVAEASFKGIVTAQRIGIDTHPYAEIIAHGSAGTLTEGEETLAFNADTHADDTQIIKALAELRGITLTLPKADQAIQQQQFVVYRQTPWRAIMARVLANGFLYLPGPEGDSIVHPESIQSAAGSAQTINFKSSGIEHFSIAQDICSQFDELKLAGWDIKQQAVTSSHTGTSSYLNDLLKPPHQSLGLTQDQNIAIPVSDAELQTQANAELFYRQLDLIQGKLVINAALSPQSLTLQPLTVIDLQDVGDTFSGKYLISSVTHQITKSGWRIHLELGLHLNHTLFSDWRKPPPIPPLTGIVGKFAADPEGLYRIPVWLPGISKDDKQVIYARLATPFASSDQTGFFMPPGEKDEVVVAFVGGDGRCPVIVGAMHNPINAPPMEYAEQYEQVGLFWGKEKMSLTISLKEGEPGMILSGGEKTMLTLSDQDGCRLSGEKASLAVGEALELIYNDEPVLTVNDNVEVNTAAFKVTVSDKMEVA